MNYILIMTEGADELAFMQVLLDRNLLKYSKEELLMESIYHSRQINGEITGYIQLLPSDDTVTIYRVGDKLTDKVKIPKAIISNKIAKKYDICILPEFEILFILNENLYEEYDKVKSLDKASTFYKKKNPNYKKIKICY